MVFRTLYGRAVEKEVLRRLGFDDIPARRRAADVNRAALAWAEGDQRRPFFLVLNYMDVHDPYQPPQPYRSRFAPGTTPGGILNGHRVRAQAALTAEQMQGEIDAYDGALTYVDEQVAQLLDALRARGARDDTLVVLTSDHGEAFGERGLFLHDNSLYRAVIRVPLIIVWPGHIPPGVRVVRPVSIAALPATLVDVLGLTGTVFPGPSLAPLWNASPAIGDWPDPVAEMARKAWTNPRFPVAAGPMKAVISPRWHYIWNRALGVELYDWQLDPGETRNLAAQAEVAGVAAALRAQLAAIPWQAAPPGAADGAGAH